MAKIHLFVILLNRTIVLNVILCSTQSPLMLYPKRFAICFTPRIRTSPPTYKMGNPFFSVSLCLCVKNNLASRFYIVGMVFHNQGQDASDAAKLGRKVEFAQSCPTRELQVVSPNVLSAENKRPAAEAINGHSASVGRSGIASGHQSRNPSFPVRDV